MLAPHLEPPVAEFYSGLLRSEARHFRNYLQLARDEVGAPMDERLAALTKVEARLIESEDAEFRFHSGAFPVAAPATLELLVDA